MAILQEIHQNLARHTSQSCKKYIKTLQELRILYMIILQEIHRNLARDIKTVQELRSMLNYVCHNNSAPLISSAETSE